jgi:hypothetical protein
MFGFLALGFFAAFAFGFIGEKKDGKDGGFLSTLIDNFKKLNDDEEESDEKDVKELRALLKKKPEDLSEKEKKRIKELSKKVDRSYLNDSELKNLDKITGSSSEDEDDDKDTGKEEDTREEDKELDFNKTLAILQSEIESKEDDESPEANDLRQAYDAMIKCTFDGNGDKRKPEDIQKEFDKLDKTIKEKIEKHVKKSSSDEKALEEYKPYVALTIGIKYVMRICAETTKRIYQEFTELGYLGLDIERDYCNKKIFLALKGKGDVHKITTTTTGDAIAAVGVLKSLSLMKIGASVEVEINVVDERDSIEENAIINKIMDIITKWIK